MKSGSKATNAPLDGGGKTLIALCAQPDSVTEGTDATIAVLHVDDDGWRDRATAWIERTRGGIVVHDAGCVDAGRERSGTKRIDCVGAEDDLPTGTDLDFRRDVWAERPEPSCVHCTSNGSVAVAAGVVAAGATDCLEKKPESTRFAITGALRPTGAA